MTRTLDAIGYPPNSARTRPASQRMRRAGATDAELAAEMRGLADRLTLAERVLAVFGKFNGKTIEGAAMHTRHVTFDDASRTQFQPVQFSQRLRI